MYSKHKFLDLLLMCVMTILPWLKPPEILSKNILGVQKSHVLKNIILELGTFVVCFLVSKYLLSQWKMFMRLLQDLKQNIIQITVIRFGAYSDAT